MRISPFVVVLLNSYHVVDYGVNGFITPTTRTTATHPFHTTTAAPSSETTASKSTSTSTTRLYVSSNTTPPLPDTSDPFIILGFRVPTADRKEIKRAYKRMALKYHPDARVASNATEEERRMANDDFARINAAYAFLTGKSKTKPTARTPERNQPQNRPGSSSRSGAYGSDGGAGPSPGAYNNGYDTPPHRRTTDYASDDWRDYMPRDEENYDTNGDSFGSIFSDLFEEIGNAASKSAAGAAAAGVAGRAMGNSGVIDEFMEFLEGNFPSVGREQTMGQDLALESLLRNGRFEDIQYELNESKTLIRQLEGNEIELDSELSAVKRAIDINRAASYMEQMRLEERRSELQARKNVVGEYIERARLRQMRLRKRIEELRLEQQQRETYERQQRRYGGYSNDTPENDGYTSYGSSDFASTNPSSNSPPPNGPGEKSWKSEGFGSSRRRGRGSSNSSSAGTRPQSQPSSYGSSQVYDAFANSNTSYNSSDVYTPRGSASSTPSSSSSTPPNQSTTSSRNYSSRGTSTETGFKDRSTPPHRRMTNNYENSAAQDRRRLREIKVDEEIEKMKRELGL